MDVDKTKEIVRFGEWFLGTLGEKCIHNCGKSLSALQLPVFRKFLSLRIKREIQFYKACLAMAEAVIEAGSRISNTEINEIIQDSMDLDSRFKRDITLLPLRVDFNYEKIIPLRRGRARLQMALFLKLLRSGTNVKYEEMARESFEPGEFLNLHNEILELYAEEAFIINQSMKSFVHIDAEEISYRMHCSMLDTGIKMNRKLTGKIFPPGQELINPG